MPTFGHQPLYLRSCPWGSRSPSWRSLRGAPWPPSASAPSCPPRLSWPRAPTPGTCRIGSQRGIPAKNINANMKMYLCIYFTLWWCLVNITLLVLSNNVLISKKHCTCPPQRSLPTETTSSRFQAAIGFRTQHIVTISGCSEPSLFWKMRLPTSIIHHLHRTRVLKLLWNINDILSKKYIIGRLWYLISITW